MKSYPLVSDMLAPVLRVALPRAPQLVVPGGTVHGVARCKNRECYCTTPEAFAVLLAHLHDLVRTEAVPLYADTLMSNHLHRLLQAPKLEALGRPLRWFLTETAKAFHTVRGRRGHLWERRYRACLLADDPYALAALRSLDRNPVRAGLVADPPPSPWSSGAAYALGTPTRGVTFHPSSLGLRRSATVRQHQDRRLLTPRADARADGRDPRWSTQRAVGRPAVVAPYVPRRRGRPRRETRPSQTPEVRL